MSNDLVFTFELNTRLHVFNSSTLRFLVFFSFRSGSLLFLSVKSVPVIDRRIYYGHAKQRLVLEKM